VAFLAGAPAAFAGDLLAGLTAALVGAVLLAAGFAAGLAGFDGFAVGFAAAFGAVFCAGAATGVLVTTVADSVVAMIGSFTLNGTYSLYRLFGAVKKHRFCRQS
jgi:hypothetical protein